MGARFFAPDQTGPGAYPASYTMGTVSFPGVKRPGRGADHPPPSKCRSHERVELYLYSPSGPSWPVMGAPLPLPLSKLSDLTFRTTGWTTQGSNPGSRDFFFFFQTSIPALRPNHSSVQLLAGFFPGVKVGRSMVLTTQLF